MEWVKKRTDFYLRAPVAMGDDAMEVMLGRAEALAGQLEQHGFIPDALLHHLTRKPAAARKTAQALVKADLWERVPGGYLIIGWDEDQEALEREVSRKERDAARKRKARASARTSEDTSTDADADGHGDSSRASEEDLEEEQDAAAANARGAQELPPPLVILKGKLDAAKLSVRWDKASPDAIAKMVALQALHGDGPLVKAALNAYRANDPVQYAQAWLSHWEAIPEPGSLRVVAAPCEKPGHSGTVSHCTACASEAIEAKTGETR